MIIVLQCELTLKICMCSESTGYHQILLSYCTVK